MPTNAPTAAQYSNAQPPPPKPISPTSLLSSPPHPLARFKQRSYDTHHSIHLPELNARLALNLDLPTPSTHSQWGLPDLTNWAAVEVVYLGNSMLERFKTTGAATQIGKLGRSGCAWNAGVGGDKNESVLYRLDQGLRRVFSQHTCSSTTCGDITSVHGSCGVKLWILASGTNNLHSRHGFNDRDLQSWAALLHQCLAIAPAATVVACDIFHRSDIPDAVTDAANEQLKAVVGDLDARDKARVTWVETRSLISKDMLVDHVHLNEEGYRVWDSVLWPFVVRVLGGEALEGEDANEDANEDTTQQQSADSGKEKRKVVAKTDDTRYETGWPALGS